MTQPRPGASPAALRASIEDRIAIALHGCPQLRTEASRHLLLNQVSRQSGVPLHVPDYATAQQWFVGFVAACGMGSAGIAAVVTAANSLGIDPGDLISLCRLRDEWESVEAAVDAPEKIWPLLRDELGAIGRVEAFAAFQRASQHRLPAPPAYCENAWDMFLYAVGMNAPQGSLPPHLAFLECIVGQLTPGTAGLVDQWNRRRAYEIGVTAGLDDARLRRDRRVRTDPTVHLIIQFERHPTDPDLCLMSWWRQWGQDKDAFDPAGRQLPVHLRDLERRTEAAILDLEELLAEREDLVALEFILPVELMHLPVESWHKESGSPLPKALGKEYPVVLRSLERLRNRHWQRVWRQRWRHLEEEPRSGGTQWSRPDGAGYLERLESGLLADRSLVALILSGPPGSVDGSNVGELEIALRCGLPVVMWHRQRSTDDHVTNAMRDFLGTDGLADLRDRARRLRLDAHRLEPHGREQHLGRHLALLWDDPDRQPERGPGPRVSLPSTGETRW